MPDRRTSAIALCFKLVGTPVGVVSVAVDHQHCDTPDVDFPYHLQHE
jgi:hypothetical protein